MARKKLTLAQRKKGVLASLRSPKTPSHLKPGLREYAKKKKWI